MSRIARFAVLVAASLSLVAALASTASAVTWTNTGNTTYTASIGAGTLSSTGSTFVCNSGTMTATVATGPFVGLTWAAETGTATFNGCAGGVNLGIDCAFTATAYGWTSLTPAVTHAIADTTCGVYSFGAKVCVIQGTLNSAATNPNGGTVGTVTSQTGGGLRTTNADSGTCPLGNGDVAHLSVMKATITNGTGGSGSGGPIITRTA